MFSINKRLKWEKSIGLFVVSIKKLEILQYDAFSEKYSFFLLCAVTAEMKMQKYLRRRVNWEMKNSWFNWKYIITLNNMVEENISQEFRLKKKKKNRQTRNYLLDKAGQNDLMSNKHKKVCLTLNHTENSGSSFCVYWVHFHFCLWLFGWYSYRNYEFCSWIKNFCNNCRH